MKTFRIFFYTFLIGLVFSSCAKEYSSEVLAAPTGSWQFTAGNTTYSGYISDFHINNGTTNQYSFTGKTKDGSQTFLMNLYADTLVTGAYAASQFQATLSYTDISGASIYTANQQVGEFVVNLTVIDSTNMNATFSGTAEDAEGKDVEITNGRLTIN